MDDKPRTYTIHATQLRLFDVQKYTIPFEGYTFAPTFDLGPAPVIYQDDDQRLGGNDNPYPEDGGW